MKKLILLFAIAIYLTSCLSSQKEINSCIGKTVKSIEKDYSSTTITFTDETSIKIFACGEPVYLEVVN
jgi:hypothetical protein